MTSGPIDHYLSRYAEATTEEHAARVQGQFAQALVVPLYDEHADSIDTITAAIEDPQCLFIAVVNAPSNAPALARQQTQALFQRLQAHRSPNLLTIDAVSQPLDPRQGVGLARKIGCDVALCLHAQGQIENPWLYQTDADAKLPSDYFATPLPEQGAVVFDHRHTSPDPALATAAAVYEAHMANYVSGLQTAGSAYAYPTLGSTIVVHAQSYAAVRGYPKRNAAEDFYLLNKIAKLHGVTYLPHTQITLAARASQRVPFGTGPALEKILQQLQEDPSGSSFLSYHPGSFSMLADALSWLEDFAHNRPTADSPVAEILAELRFDKVEQQVLAQYPDPTRRLQVLSQWFDAAKTLRFIHIARRWHADQPLLKMLEQLPAVVQKRWPTSLIL